MLSEDNPGVFKPDTLNGQPIFRRVTEEGGVNHVNKEIFFPPAIKVSLPRPRPIEQLIEAALTDLITVADHTGDPVIKAQAVTFKADLKKHQNHWLRSAAVNERSILVTKLIHLGFKEAAEAIQNG